MPKQAKIEKVKELTAHLEDSDGAMLADFQGLNVKDATELRRGLKDVGVVFTVSKNTLTRRAATGAGLEGLLPLLEGPTAIAFFRAGAVEGAKGLLEMTRRFPALRVKGALIEGRIMGEEEAKALAFLDSREVSAARIAGMLQAPLRNTAYLLRAPLQRMAFALAERGRQAA